ncbi:uncharacterized protein EDB93DRAFT_1248627 [Suillus bovinus]|uniref:uncharacterized protein n=1 Tax=Suillus bovinus TaxID=48563 RepID=UPI001B8700D5|nr:uncharacterized protein EDB93DRAFT_1248627 [Suillus bovinus]KAG2153719.1 hypothetical protein EDB93DRAFT_1248627 [Suillus bovinus]
MSLLTLKTWPSIVALVVAAAPRGAFAQIVANITCLSSFGWMNNSRDQNPCLVTAYLGSPCSGGSYEIIAIPAGTQYSGPPLDGTNPCQCSSVTYSMTSACGVCQGLIPVTWSSWKTYCSPAFTQLYPTIIPTGTAVPNWAYLDVVTSNIFNATAAQLDGDLPESNATTPLSTASASTTSAFTTSVSKLTTSTESSTPNSKSSNVGATAGGVVGGIVAVGVIAGLATWFFIRRRRSHRTASADFSQPQMTQPPRIYDPADPSTFPPPLYSTIQTTASSTNQESANSQGFSQQSRPGQYNGTPEV